MSIIGGSRFSKLLLLLMEADMMMLPTSCDPSSLRRKSRSFAYTALVILMLVLVITFANTVAGSVTDAVALGCIPKNNSLLFSTAPLNALPDSALDMEGRSKCINKNR